MKMLGLDSAINHGSRTTKTGGTKKKVIMRRVIMRELIKRGMIERRLVKVGLIKKDTGKTTIMQIRTSDCRR
jgi:hypothetical protein